MNVRVRKFKKSDAPFIYNSWSKNAWYSEKNRDELFKKEWFRSKLSSIAELLKDGTVHIACDQSNDDFILGYSVFKGEKLEWAYVKKDYRKQGIGRLLIKKKENQNGRPQE
jgi:ribosomal protein S18 acetylase RimI-like enzyme